MQASSGPRFLNDFFDLFSKFVKKTKPEIPAVVWEICDVRQRHIEFHGSVEINFDRFPNGTGCKSQSVDETQSKPNMRIFPITITLTIQTRTEWRFAPPPCGVNLVKYNTDCRAEYDH